MNDKLRPLAEIDRVIHEPSRLMIVAMLTGVKQADFLYLQNETAMNKGTLSSHLSRLEQAGYVTIEKTYRGKVPRTVCRLSVAGRAAFRRYRKALSSTL